MMTVKTAARHQADTADGSHVAKAVAGRVEIVRLDQSNTTLS